MVSSWFYGQAIVEVRERRPDVSSGSRKQGRERERDGRPRRIFRGEDLCRSSGEAERRKTAEDLPGLEDPVDLLARVRWKTAEDLPGEKT